MTWDKYQLISNLGDDLKAMAAREDKRIVFELGQANAERAAAFDALAESGVVLVQEVDGVYDVRLEI